MKRLLALTLCSCLPVLGCGPAPNTEAGAAPTLNAKSTRGGNRATSPAASPLQDKNVTAEISPVAVTKGGKGTGTIVLERDKGLDGEITLEFVVDPNDEEYAKGLKFTPVAVPPYAQLDKKKPQKVEFTFEAAKDAKGGRVEVKASWPGLTEKKGAGLFTVEVK